jgi:hypothetical protein
MVAVQKRSGMHHLVSDDGLATRCGRILYRPNWRLVEEARGCDCLNCLASLTSKPLGRKKESS